MFVNKHFKYLGCALLESKFSYNAGPSAHYFFVKTKTSVDFQICISVPLIVFKMFWLSHKFINEIRCLIMFNEMIYQQNIC